MKKARFLPLGAAILTGAGRAALPCQELAAARRAAVAAPGDRGYAEALRPWSRRC